EGDALRPLDAARREAIDRQVRDWSMEGFRVLALAVRRLPRRPAHDRADETGLALAGFLLFLDPPKAGMAETLEALAARGIRVKMISGDSRHVAVHLAGAIGLPHRAVLTGGELAGLTREALF